MSGRKRRGRAAPRFFEMRHGPKVRLMAAHIRGAPAPLAPGATCAQSRSFRILLHGFSFHCFSVRPPSLSLLLGPLRGLGLPPKRAPSGPGGRHPPGRREGRHPPRSRWGRLGTGLVPAFFGVQLPLGRFPPPRKSTGDSFFDALVERGWQPGQYDHSCPPPSSAPQPTCLYASIPT